MSRKSLIIVQEQIARGLDPEPAARRLGADLATFNCRSVLELPDHLGPLEDRCRAEGLAPLVFASIQACRAIERSHPLLASGVCVPWRFLRHSVYSSCLPPEVMLNSYGVYLPWGRILGQLDLLHGALGERLFIRPNSPSKPFTGFVLDQRDPGELARMQAAEHIPSEELCFICAARSLPEDEHRVWIVDGRPISAAPYGWFADTTLPKRTPDAVWTASERIGRLLEPTQVTLVADFVICDGKPQLVELNAMSTSGWYRGVDLDALFSAFEASLF